MTEGQGASGPARSGALAAIASNAGWMFADNIVRVGIGLAVGVMLANHLGPQAYGSFSFALAMCTLAAAIVPLGMRNLVVRDIVRAPDGGGGVLGTAMLAQVFAGALAYAALLALIGTTAIGDPAARAAIAILGSLILFRAGEGIEAWFVAHGLSRYPALTGTAIRLLAGAAKLALIFANAPLIAFAWAWAAEAALLAVALVALYARKARGSRWGFSGARARALLRESWPLAISGVAAMIYLRIDQVMLGEMAGSSEVGIYSVAARLSEGWYFVGTAIVMSTFPAIVRARDESVAACLAILQGLFTVLVVLALAASVAMTLGGGTLIGLLFGTAYAGAEPILVIHIWASVFVFLGVASGRWLVVEGRHGAALKRTVAGAIANIALNWLLIPLYGGVGAAIATVVSYAVAALLYDAFDLQLRRVLRMKLRALALIDLLAEIRSRLR